jgi:hypothetical protein
MEQNGRRCNYYNSKISNFRWNIPEAGGVSPASEKCLKESVARSGAARVHWNTQIYFQLMRARGASTHPRSKTCAESSSLLHYMGERAHQLSAIAQFMICIARVRIS